MNTLLNEMQRYLQVIERAEADPEVWAKLTEGTGIATANGYRAALKSAADTNGTNPHKDALELARTFIVSNVDSSLTAKVLPAIDRAIAAAQLVAPEQATILRQQLRLSSAILQTLCKADLVREDCVFTIEGESYVFGDLMDKNDAAIGAASLSSQQVKGDKWASTIEQLEKVEQGGQADRYHFLFVNVMRLLDDETRILLRDALIERTPKVKGYSVYEVREAATKVIHRNIGSAIAPQLVQGIMDRLASRPLNGEAPKGDNYEVALTWFTRGVLSCCEPGEIFEDGIEADFHSTYGHELTEPAASLSAKGEGAHPDTIRLNELEQQGETFGFEGQAEGRRWIFEGTVSTLRDYADQCIANGKQPVKGEAPKEDARIIEVDFDGNVLAKIEVGGTFTVLAAMDGWGKPIYLDKITVTPAPEVSAPVTNSVDSSLSVKDANQNAGEDREAAPTGLVPIEAVREFEQYLRSTEDYFDDVREKVEAFYARWTGNDGHASDCATHNEPAEPNGPCDCAAAPKEGEQPEPSKKLQDCFDLCWHFKRMPKSKADLLEFVQSLLHEMRQPNPEPLVAALLEDAVLLNWLQDMMLRAEDYCEIFFAGLRKFTGTATAFQIESNPQRFPTASAPTIREAIKLAMSGCATLTQWEASQPSPWIAVSERLPTETDADKNGLVRVRHYGCAPWASIDADDHCEWACPSP